MARFPVLALVAVCVIACSSAAAGATFEYDGRVWTTSCHHGTWFMHAGGETLAICPGQMTALFSDDRSFQDVEALLDSLDVGAGVIRSTPAGWYDFSVSLEEDPGSIASSVQSVWGVLAAVPAFYGYLDATPNDSSFSNQWGLHNTGQSGGTSDCDIDAPDAWDVASGDTTVIVAVLDSGADLDHVDLDSNIWVNWSER